MGVCVYYIALYVVPSFGLFEGLLKSSWVSSGDITQISYLFISLILIYVFSKGDLSIYGFISIKLKQLVKPVLVSIPIGFLAIILNIIVVVMSGIQPEGEGPPALEQGALKAIISVWVIASICEEIFYRGLILGYLAPLKKYSFKLLKSRISLPVSISALGFGLGHLCLLGEMNSFFVINIIISATVLGIIAGYYREKTGSIIPAIAVHMTFNIVGFTIPLIMLKLAQG